MKRTGKKLDTQANDYSTGLNSAVSETFNCEFHMSYLKQFIIV
jgi:hypothetical protein